MKQLALELKTWGGKRKGAGRPPSGLRAGVSHLLRPALARRHPVHVTLRLCEGVGYLRAAMRVQVTGGRIEHGRAVNHRWVNKALLCLGVAAGRHQRGFLP